MLSMKQLVITSNEEITAKIETLVVIGANRDTLEIFYLDNDTGEKWVQKCYFDNDSFSGNPALRLV